MQLTRAEEEEEEGDNAVDLTIHDEDEDMGPDTQDFIDDSQADTISPGYGNGNGNDDEETGGSKKRKLIKSPQFVDDEAAEDAEEEEEEKDPFHGDPAMLALFEKKVKLAEKRQREREQRMTTTTMNDSKWGEVVDFTKAGKGKGGGRKLEKKQVIGAKFLLPGRQFVWNELRTLSSDESKSSKFGGGKRKFGQKTEENTFPNLIWAREFRCSKTNEDKLYQFNVPWQYFDDFIAASKLKRQEMVDLGYLSPLEE